MTLSINLNMNWEVAVEGDIRRGGSAKPFTITTTREEYFEKTLSLPDSTVTVVFDVADDIGEENVGDLSPPGSAGDVASFHFLYFETDQEVHVQLETDTSADIGKETFTVTVPADQFLFLPSSVSYANYTADFGGGTLDNINRVSVQNISGSAANIKIVASF